jgi:hypothetical protein
MSEMLMKMVGEQMVLYIAIPSTDNTHTSTKPAVAYVKVAPGQTLEQAMTALGL